MSAGFEGTAWPLPQDYFELEWQGQPLTFARMSGLSVTAGLQKGKVTLINGRVKVSAELMAWVDQIKFNTIQRQSITLCQRNESGAPVHCWRLINGWVLDICLADLKADGEMLAIGSMEIAHEGATLTRA